MGRQMLLARMLFYKGNEEEAMELLSQHLHAWVQHFAPYRCAVYHIYIHTCIPACILGSSTLRPTGAPVVWVQVRSAPVPAPSAPEARRRCVCVYLYVHI